MATGEGYEMFSADFWADAWVQQLLSGGRSDELLLFEWLWTGPLRTTSGLVHAPIGVVREFIGWPYGPKRFRGIVERATEQPSAGLAWFPDRGYWWVKNYLRRRADRPNLLISAIKDLARHPRELAALVALYNLERGLDLTKVPAWETYAAQHVRDVADAETLRERFGIDSETYLKGSEQTQTQTQTQTADTGGGGSGKPAPPPRPTWEAESQALKSIDGYPFDEQKDRALMDALAEAYGQLDLAQELRKLKTWLASKGLLPVKGQAGPRKRVRNWMGKADEFGQNDRGNSGQGGSGVAASWGSGGKHE